MKKFLPTLLSLIFLFTTAGLQAQILEKIMDKKRERIRDTIVDKSVGGIGKEINKLFGSDDDDSESSASSETKSSSSSSSSSSANTATTNAMMAAMGISTGTADVKPVYNFDGFIEMTLTNYEDGKQQDESTIYKTFIDSKSMDYGMQFTDDDQDVRSLIIFDSENSLMLTLSDSEGEKTGFALDFSYEDLEEEVEETAEEYDEEEYTDPYSSYKTGKTKKILGYTCHEYRIENEESDGIVTMWITKDMDKEIRKTYLKNSTFTGLFMYAYYTEGMVMEYITEDKKNNDKMVMTVTDIDLKRKESISTGDYTIMNMGGMMEEADEEEENE